jgi:LacI family transcriptional regulator
MQGWKGHAIIALIDDERELRLAGGLGIPVVNLGASQPKSPGVPRVLVNNRACGRLAADHLLSRGLRHLALFGWRNAWYADERRLGFCQRAAEAGVRCDTLLRDRREESAKNWTQRFAEPAKWLATLPRPCGVFAVHDYMAQLLMEACHEAKLRIPDDVAVIGMDNDETICESAAPTLTSISRSSEQVGWEAAALLDRMMHGEPPPTEDRVLEPNGVVARQSTDRLYCSDPVAQRALDYMRAHLATPFNIEQVAEHVGTSKRTLEMRFRASLECPPHRFLAKLRVQHAQALLQMPKKRTVEQIARESGFGTVQAFYAAMQRLTGESPGAFRQRHRAKLETSTGRILPQRRADFARDARDLTAIKAE